MTSVTAKDIGEGSSSVLSRVVGCLKFCTGKIAHSPLFTFIGFVFLGYALVANEIKVLCFNKPVDPIFANVSYACMAYFCLELFLSCVLEADYFLSFFFYLDIMSTVSLFGDLQVVQDSLGWNQNSFVNARFARVMRVLRLLRILKIYKAVSQHKRKMIKLAQNDTERQTLAERQTFQTDESDVARLFQESNVGKKLSELTTRRVIVIVIVMMLVLPVISTDDDRLMPFSPGYGADVVADSFTVVVTLAQNQSADPKDVANAALQYQTSMLKYIHYHNWFNWRGFWLVNTPADHYNNFHRERFFWVGIVAKKRNTMGFSHYKDILEMARLPPDIVERFGASVGKVTQFGGKSFSVGHLPPITRILVSQPWALDCSTDNEYRFGISVLAALIPAGSGDSHSVGVNYIVDCPQDLRVDEQDLHVGWPLVRLETAGAWNLVFYFDARHRVKSLAIEALINMAFICVSLTVSAYLFNSDARRMVLQPLEATIWMVEDIGKDPMQVRKKNEEDDDAPFLRKGSSLKKKTEANQSQGYLCCRRQRKAPQDDHLETKMLEATVLKLASLLALAFGRAGARIIAHNMDPNSTGVNAMIPGVRVECILGLVRIQNFGCATEVLQEKVMTFLNQIAEIVHSVIDEMLGSPSKQHGDAFLVIWRIREIEKKNEIELEDDMLQRMADVSLVAFARILGAVHSSRALEAYRSHPGFMQRFGRHTRFTVSSGLHYGWAIEGAVGSEFKIDTCYLSPNVSIAESVEATTQHYGVNIMIAESLYSCCSPSMASSCRMIDRCLLAGGSTKPQGLYTFDLDPQLLETEAPIDIHWSAGLRAKVKLQIEQRKTLYSYGCVDIWLQSNPEVLRMRKTYSGGFLPLFNMGFENYLQGEWSMARRLLSRTRMMLGFVDGPSVALLKYMEAENYKAPRTWEGYRDLSSHQSMNAPLKK